jgi:hypothetical protein
VNCDLIHLGNTLKLYCGSAPLVHTSFTGSRTLGRFTPPSYANWLAVLRTLFPVQDEFLLADAIFSFASLREERRRSRLMRSSYFCQRGRGLKTTIALGAVALTNKSPDGEATRKRKPAGVKAGGSCELFQKIDAIRDTLSRLERYRGLVDGSLLYGHS